MKLTTGWGGSYTDRSLADRCLVGFNAGPPMISGAYNNNGNCLPLWVDQGDGGVVGSTKD